MRRLHLRRGGLRQGINWSLGLLGAGLLVLPATSVASAVALPAKKPSGSLAFVARNIDVGASPVVTYSTKNVPGNATVQLQELVGLKHVWHRVANPRAVRGRVALPRVSAMGTDSYSIAIVNSRHQLLFRSKSQTLHVFGTVTLQTFCHDSEACSGNPGSERIGSNLFNYVEGVPEMDTNPPSFDTLFKVRRTTCRAADIQVAVGWNDQLITADYPFYAHDVVTATVATARLAAQTISVPIETVGTLNATLDGGSWELDVATSATGDFGDSVFVNGTLTCFTPSGLPG